MAKQTSIVDTPETVETAGGEETGGGILLGNRRLFGIIGIGLLLVLGALFLYFSTRASANDEAQVELARIRPYVERGEYVVAIRGDSSKTYGGAKIRGLEAIVGEWKSTPAGKIAALYLGNSYLALGQAEKAREPYSIATEASAELIRSAAHAGLGAVAEAAGRSEEAAKEYEKAASEDRIELNTAEYLVAAARNYERAKKNEEAIKLYKRVATEYATSQANTQARLALARHNVEL